MSKKNRCNATEIKKILKSPIRRYVVYLLNGQGFIVKANDKSVPESGGIDFYISFCEPTEKIWVASFPEYESIIMTDDLTTELAEYMELPPRLKLKKPPR